MLQRLDQRRPQAEWMDQPELDGGRLAAALAGLARLNRWSRSVRILWPALASFARHKNIHQLRVLDLASGGGDIPAGLWRMGRHHGLHLAIDAWEINPRSVEFARALAANTGAKVTFSQHDALADPIPPGYDVILSSLFLHHLDESRAVALLGKMAGAVGGVVLINDLRRSRAGLALAMAASRVLTRSEVVHNDAPASVRGAYTINEAADLARRAGLAGARVTRRWPWRFLLEWRR